MSMKIKVKLKLQPLDFVVREILPDRRILDIDTEFDYSQEGECLHCMLRKDNVDQFKALSFIASALDISSKNIAVCGTKDKKAITVQRISICGCKKEDIDKLSFEYMDLKFLGRGSVLNIGELYGNNFDIVLRNIYLQKDGLQKHLDRIKQRPVFPNYFGVQRFGVERPISHVIGKHVILSDFKSAVMDYITVVFPRESEDLKAARRMAKTDLKKSLELFPVIFYYERIMILYLLDNPDDYVGAFSRLPFNLQKLMVHAYQSYLFNKVLDAVVSENIGDRRLEIPLFGFGMNAPKDKRLAAVMRNVLKEEAISLQSFRDDVSRKLGSKGGRRRAFETAFDFSVIDIGEDDMNKGKLKCRISFFLRKGTYATTFLSTFFDLS
ncbi:MAG: tRNA pseudouridine(13) synthase TruD [archaeon]|nr:tRNA pseudouridine(13) synthase TruD [archaeon]